MGIETIRKLSIDLRRGTMGWHGTRAHTDPLVAIHRLGTDVYHEVDGHNVSLTELVGSARELRPVLAARPVVRQGNEYLAFHDVEAKQFSEDDWRVSMTDASIISLNEHARPGLVRHLRAEHQLGIQDATLFGEINGIGMEILAISGHVFTQKITYEIQPKSVMAYVQAAGASADEKVIKMMVHFMSLGANDPQARIMKLAPGYLAGAALLILNDLFPRLVAQTEPVLTEQKDLPVGVVMEITVGNLVAVQVLRDGRIRAVMNRPHFWNRPEYPMNGNILALGEQQLLQAA